MSVARLEELYPYLRGHVYAVVAGSRSGACALCGAFRNEHPADRQGPGEALSVEEVQSILAEIDGREKARHDR